MSHFVVAVFCNDPSEIEERLAPFVEEVNEHSKYVKFCDCTEEVETKWRELGGSDNPKEVATQKALGTFGEYESIDDLINKWFGFIKKNGRYGYFHNPNAQWDWYVVGGRWPGELKIKSGVSCDKAKIKDIDFDSMSALAKDKRWCTYAMLNLEGKWHQKGKMGWFGFSNATPDGKKAFIDYLYEYIKSVNLDTYLVIVDCHI